jgi:hypothetical protein
MEGLIPLLLTAGIGGGFLYAAKKKEGFAATIDPPVETAMRGGDFLELAQSGGYKFNPIINLTDPKNNPFFSENASRGEISQQDAKVKQALGSALASPSSEGVQLRASDTSLYDITQTKGGKTLEHIRMCEKLRASSCDAFNDPKFAESCGVCLEGGRDSGGNATLGGLFMGSDDKLNARESAARMGAKRVTYTPTVGQCAPGAFAVNKAQCEVIKKRLECEKKQNFDVPGCSQCYQDERFYFLDELAEFDQPHLVLVGQGKLSVSYIDTTGKLTTLQKDLSTNPTTLVVPKFNEGDILELQISPADAKVAGYLTGKTATGEFTMDIIRLIQVDLESNAKPRMSGFDVINGIDVTVIRPSAGKASMRLPVRNVFSFLAQDQAEAASCAAAPFIKSSASAEFLNSGPCYKKGQQPGRYSLECLQGIFTNAGCTVDGEGYPSNDAKAKALMQGAGGRQLSVAQIAGKVYEANQAAFSGQRGGKKMALPEWDEVSRFCTGKQLNNPCDMDDKVSGPLSADCLSYLWQNTGAVDKKPGTLGPTYSNSSKPTSLSGKEMRYCTANGTMAPIDARGQYNQTAIAAAHKAGGVDAVKALYNQIHALANDNGQTDAKRKAAIEQCYGLMLEPLPDATIPGSVNATMNTTSVLDSRPGRTKSALQRNNYTPMDWSRFSKPVSVLGPYGMNPWGTWWAAGFPGNAGAKWIWTNPRAAADEPSWGWQQFFYRYTNTTNAPIQVTLIVAADNVSSILVNDALVGNSTGNVTRVSVRFLPGENKLQINAANQGGPAGLCVVAQGANGTVFVSDGTWTTNT